MPTRIHPLITSEEDRARDKDANIRRIGAFFGTLAALALCWGGYQLIMAVLR